MPSSRVHASASIVVPHCYAHRDRNLEIGNLKTSLAPFPWLNCSESHLSEPRQAVQPFSPISIGDFQERREAPVFRCVFLGVVTAS